MRVYQKMLRKLISHPQSALSIMRQFTNRELSYCKKCGVVRKCELHHTDRRGIRTYRCRDCNKTFSELYGTVFYRSKVPLAKWCRALLEWVISTGSISAAEVSRRLDVSYDTAWNMLMKIRKELSNNLDQELLSELVEADEAWFGKKRNQDIVMGMVQRSERKLRFEIIPNVQEKTLYPLVQKHVQRGTSFCTDSRITYAITGLFYHHQTVNHSKGEFARDGVHTNTIEQIWGDLKGIIRTIHHGVSRTYRYLYLAQYAFRYQYVHNSNLFYFSFFILLSPTFPRY